MPESNNIWLNTENLAFSLPLIFVCVTYAYFNFIPLNVGLPILGVVVLLYLIRSQFQKQREKKLVHLDESAIQDLIGEDEAAAAAGSSDQASLRKAKNKVQARLAQERKKAAKAQQKKGGAAAAAAADEEDENDALETFAKKASSKKKK